MTWLPLRRALGVTGFGIAAWTAAAAGDPLIEPHDETTSGAGDPHEELYLVLEGREENTIRSIAVPTFSTGFCEAHI